MTRTKHGTKRDRPAKKRLENLSRRGFLGGLGTVGAGASISSLFTACNANPQVQTGGIGIPPTLVSSKPPLLIIA